MKTKLLMLSILSIITISSFANAWELSLEPSNWKYSPGCMVAIDIMMDPAWQQISATDIVLETSMQFVKFEPTDLFPYFYGPIIDNKTNIISIIWFTALWPSQRVSKSWSIWKIYLKPKNKSDTDWSVKFYFKNKWNTTDTNLSIGWWVDVLESTRNWFYTFNWTDCDYPDQNKEINNQDILLEAEKQISITKDKIEKDHMSDVYHRSRDKNKTYIISLFVAIILLVLYFKIFKWKSKKK